jgi:hypothetical protein
MMSSSEDTPHETDADDSITETEVYQSVIRVVDYNSGRVQPPLASKPSIVGTLKRGGYAFEDISHAITIARRNGELFQTTDSDGRRRLGIDDIQTLRDKIGSCLEYRDDPPREIIALANQRIAELKEDQS